MPTSAKVPKEYEAIFAKAHAFVRDYFGHRREDASKGTIEISGERYLLIRAASMSVDFFETVRELYKDVGEEEALHVAQSLLFDIAHAIGRADARNFHKKMHLTDPVEKLSAGPVHFSHSGWAFVDIFPESRPTPDENYYLVYDHPFSFESAAWEQAGKTSDCPICVMNAGYSSGWCEESFGITLVASEILCKAKGDDVCRFIMAHPSKIEGYIRDYLKKEPTLARRIKKYEIPGFFKRKQVEASLRESEQRYRTLVENVPAMVYRGREDWSVQAIGPQFEIITGYDLDEIRSGRINWLDLIHSEDKARVLEEGSRLVTAPIKIEQEYRILKKDGQVAWIRDVKRSLIEGGKFQGVDGVVVDITEQKMAEQAVVESEKRYRAIFETSPEAIVLLDTEGFVVDVNDRVREVLGFGTDEIKGKHLLEMPTLTPESREKGLEAMRRRLKGEVLPPYELEFVNRDGEKRIGLIRARTLKNQQGEAIADLVMISDVTEQKAAEEALTRARDELEMRVKARTKELQRERDFVAAVIENSFDGIAVVGKEGEIKFFSPSMERIYGYTQAEMVSMERMIELVLQDDETKQRALDMWRKDVETKQPPERMFQILRKDGEKRWCRFQLSRMGDDFVLNAQDITHRKLAEDALREALRFKSDFMATMSHELRTPLNSIIGCADLVLKDKKLDLPERRAGNLKSVLVSADKLLSIINNILDMARIDAGSIPINVERFRLEDLVDKSIDFCHGIAEAKSIDVVKRVEGEVPEMFTDEEKLGHVLVNLLSNAIKFADRGEVSVAAHVCEEDKDCVAISVQDRGIGIAEDKRHVIFDQFKQAEVTPTRRRGGIGLGLAIVKAYLELLGGRIKLDSEPGKGSTFTIIVPVSLPSKQTCDVEERK